MQRQLRSAPAPFTDVRNLHLSRVLTEVGSGDIQLPNLQRNWCWPIKDIEKLLVSIINGRPFGNPYFLETGGKILFKFRPINGAEYDGPERIPEFLVFDGQQRLTALYQALCSKNPIKVLPKTGNNPRYYLAYMDIRKIIWADQPAEDALMFVETDKDGNPLSRKATDWRDPERQYRDGIFPTNRMFDFMAWNNEANAYWHKHAGEPECNDLMASFGFFGKSVYTAFTSCSLHINFMHKTVPLREVARFYEDSNTSASKLKPFDLVIARYAVADYDIRIDVADFIERMEKETNGLLSKVTDKQMLVANMALSNLTRGTSYFEVLDLPLESYVATKDAVIDGFLEAYALFTENCIFNVKFMPPSALVTGLAIIFAVLGKWRAREVPIRKKLCRWVWCCSLSNYHLKSNDAGVLQEIPAVLRWLEGEPAPSSVADFVISEGTLAKATKGPILSLFMTSIMKRGARDFGTNVSATLQLFLNDGFDVHHIFPQDYSKKMGFNEVAYDSVLNKTILSPSTNRMIGSDAPSRYLAAIESAFCPTVETLNETLASHMIDPDALRSDDFDEMLRARLRHLVSIVEEETGGKVVLGDDSEQYEIPESAEFMMRARGSYGFLRKVENGVILLSGSVASTDVMQTMETAYADLRKAMIEKGDFVLREDGRMELVDDRFFHSPSAAFSVLSGQKANGNGWKPIDRSQAPRREFEDSMHPSGDPAYGNAPQGEDIRVLSGHF